MKKVFLFGLFLTSLVSFNALAFDCTDGKVLTGVNGKQYCQSKLRLRNWYVAFTWCDAHNMQLATMHEICDVDANNKWDGNKGEGKCLNLRSQNGATGFSDVYLASSTTANGRVIRIEGTAGKVNDDTKTSPHMIAVCKMF